MTNSNRIFTNVGLVALVALLFTGCALLPNRGGEVETGVRVEDEMFIELSDDDSLDAIETEIEETMIEDADDDLAIIEAELETGLEVEATTY